MNGDEHFIECPNKSPTQFICHLSYVSSITMRFCRVPAVAAIWAVGIRALLYNPLPCPCSPCLGQICPDPVHPLRGSCPEMTPVFFKPSSIPSEYCLKDPLNRPNNIPFQVAPADSGNARRPHGISCWCQVLTESAKQENLLDAHYQARLRNHCP